MYMEQLSQALSLAGMMNYTVLNNSSGNTGNGVDMAQFKRVLFIVVTATVGGSLTPQLQGATTSGGAFSNIGTGTGTALTASNKIMTIEYRDDEAVDTNRFVRLLLTETAASNSAATVIAIGASGKHQPDNIANDIAAVLQRLIA